MEADLKKAVDKYISGAKPRDAVRGKEISRRVLNEYLRKNDLNRTRSSGGRQYDIDPTVFDEFDPETAYWFGFFSGDGWLTSRGNHVSITLREKTHLQKWKSFLKAGHPIKQIDASGFGEESGNPSWKLVINCKPLAKRLRKLGLDSNKTSTLRFPHDVLPKNLRSDYVRGFFDADGSISVSDTPWVAQKYKISFGKNRAFIMQLQDVIQKETGLPKRKVPDDDKISIPFGHLAYNGNRQALKLCRWMYQNEQPRLERKFERYQNLVREVEEVTRRRKKPLTDQQVREIRSRYENEDISQRELGEEYNRSQSAIGHIVNFKKYKDVK